MIKQISHNLAGALRNICLRPGLCVADEPLGKKVLILAPHPDDEVIGCGGALIKHLNRGDKIKIIFLSSNTFNDSDEEICQVRKKEARSVMGFLGVDSYEFISPQELKISLEDQKNSLIDSILDDFSPDTLYLPSFLEEHSEHKKATYLIARALKDKKYQAKTIRCILYQIWGETCPNFLLKVTDVFSKSLTALQKYKSQLKNFNYLQMHKQLRMKWATLATGRNMYEAFYVCSGDKLARLSSGRLKQVTYRGLLALPYTSALALRRKLKNRE